MGVYKVIKFVSNYSNFHSKTISFDELLITKLPDG